MRCEMDEAVGVERVAFASCQLNVRPTAAARAATSRWLAADCSALMPYFVAIVSTSVRPGSRSMLGSSS